MILEGILVCENGYFEDLEYNPEQYITYYEDIIYG